MEYSDVTLDNLPDEILLIIFKQMSNVEVLYSLSDVNQRLNKIVYDPVFTSHLIFSNHFSNNSITPLPTLMLDRFFFQIFPQIHDKIQRLGLAASFIDRILLFPKFPNLSKLGLFDLEIEYAKYLFIGKIFHLVVKVASLVFYPFLYKDLIDDKFYLDERSLIHKFKNQLSSLFIDIAQNAPQNSIKDAIKLVFTNILTKFTNLQYLNICSNSIVYKRMTVEMPPLTVISSTLLELHICLEDITDCLCLLDGRFNQLHTLYVKMYFISSSPLTMNNKVHYFD
jgi:hypothetical protein